MSAPDFKAERERLRWLHTEIDRLLDEGNVAEVRPLSDEANGICRLIYSTQTPCGCES